MNWKEGQRVTAVMRNVIKSKRQNDVREHRKGGVITRITPNMAEVLLENGITVRVKFSNLEPTGHEATTEREK